MGKRTIVSKLIILLLIVALFTIYARYIGPSGIKTREYNITSTNIPDSFDGFTIVQFSDVLYGSTINKKELTEVISKINKIKPNIVVFTGDLFCDKFKNNKKDIQDVKELLKSIDAEIGKYYVRGDRDIKNKISDEILKNSDFIDLNNTYELIYYKGLTPIVIYGLDSLNGEINLDETFSYPNEKTDSNYMATYRILLAHEPDSVKKIEKYNISLMLSGHSLNSSINIPYLKKLYKIKGATSYYDQEYNVNGIKLYISSGLGTNNYHMRLFSKPSISIFRLFSE